MVGVGRCHLPVGRPLGCLGLHTAPPRSEPEFLAARSAGTLTKVSCSLEPW